MPPCCAACPSDMYADHPLRLAQEIVTENFFLCLLWQKGKGGGEFRMVQNGGLAAGGKKIFFKLLRLGKLDKLLIHQIVKGNFPFPPPAQLQNYIYGGVTNDNLAKGVKGVLDIHFVGFIFGHGNSPSLIIVRGGSTPCCRPLIAYQQRRAGLSTAARYAPFILTVDWLGWLCYDNIVISSALIAKGTNQTDYVWFLHLRYRDLAYSQPDNPIKIPWIDMQISH